jgi:hypothetical protein
MRSRFWKAIVAGSVKNAKKSIKILGVLYSKVIFIYFSIGKTKKHLYHRRTRYG